MAILVKCRCGERFQTNDANAGRSATCPDCGKELVVPNLPKETTVRREDPAAVTSGRAIVSLILGLSSLICVAITGLPAILFGLKAIADVNRGRGMITGRKLAIAGIFFGAFGSTVMSVVQLRPILQGFRQGFDSRVCMANLKEIGLAFHNAEQRNGAFLPWSIRSKTGQPLLSWRVAVLAYMGPEEKKLYNRFRLDEPWNSPHNQGLIPFMPSVFRCPAGLNGRPGETYYQVVIGPNTMFPGKKGVATSDVKDGMSNTILVVEAAKGVTWTEPMDLSQGGKMAMAGSHGDDFQALFADGSVRWLPLTIPPADLKAFITRNGNEAMNMIY